MSAEQQGDTVYAAERVRIHAVKRATRFDVLEPIRQGARAWPDSEIILLRSYSEDESCAQEG